MKIKDKNCDICGEKFKPSQPLQMVCSAKCAYEYVQKKNKKDWQKKKSELNFDLKTHADHSKELEKIVNLFIRLRDKNKPCISCDALPGTYTMSAGHFYPVGTYKNLRFNEDNIHGQCWFNCNKNKHGNLLEYRPRLIKRIGLARVDELDRLKNTDLKLSIPELIDLKVIFRKKISALKVL